MYNQKRRCHGGVHRPLPTGAPKLQRRNDPNGSRFFRSGGPESTYQPDGLNGDIHQILYPINHGILRFTGFDVVPPFIVWGPAHLDTAARRQALAAYAARLSMVTTMASIPYPSLSAYDGETYRLHRE
jgi:hypothetical protein